MAEMEKCIIPGLPYDLSLQILARVPRKYYAQHLSRVSRAWKQAVTSDALFNQRKWLQVTESWIYTAVVSEQENRTRFLWYASAEGSEWFPLPLMPTEHRPVYGFNCAVIGELLFVIGGCEWPESSTSFSFPATNKVSVLNARTNRWSCIQGMNDARANSGCGVVNGKVYVAGGESSVDVGTVDDSTDFTDDFTDSCNCLRSSETYDPLTKEWESMGNMTRAMHFVRGREADGKFRVCGFACDGDLQFCQVAEVWEEAEMKWVQLEEDHGGAADVSMFEMDDESEGEAFKKASARTASLSLCDVENGTGVNEFEWRSNPHARLVIML